MVDLVPTPVTDPVASSLLADYFAERSRDFPVVGGYRISSPDPAAFTAPSGIFLVVWDAGRAIGCGGVRRIDDDGAVRYEIKHLWVDPAGRGQGLGRMLLRELEARAAGFGADRVVLDTNASLTAAAGLYASSGYRSVPPYNDNPNASDWYAKDLVQTD
jgi:ribosomal protein S18 acetylase RimI-like enzyme